MDSYSLGDIFSLRTSIGTWFVHVIIPTNRTRIWDENNEM